MRWRRREKLVEKRSKRRIFIAFTEREKNKRKKSKDFLK
jgi:hypothetical protein